MASKVIHDQEHRGNLIGIYDYYQPKKSCIGLMLFFVTGLVHAQLVAQDDSFGIPFGQPLHALGILKNDTLKGETDFGGTAELVTGVTNGTLTCPDVTPGLCADGSFQYIPGSGFSGFSGFRLYAATRFDMPLLTHKRPPAPKTIPNNQKKIP